MAVPARKTSKAKPDSSSRSEEKIPGLGDGAFPGTISVYGMCHSF